MHRLTFFIQYLKTSFCPRLQVWFDVPRIQVSNAHQKPRSGEGPEFTETEYLTGRSSWFLILKMVTKPKCNKSPNIYAKLHLNINRQKGIKITNKMWKRHTNEKNDSSLKNLLKDLHSDCLKFPMFLPGWDFLEWEPSPQSRWRKVPLVPQVRQEERWCCNGLTGLHFPAGNPLRQTHRFHRKLRQYMAAWILLLLESLSGRRYIWAGTRSQIYNASSLTKTF